MAAWIKAENVQGQVGWYIHLGHREQPMLTSPMLIVDGGTFDWRQVTAEFIAPAEADLADLGTVLRGTGTAWFDDVTLACLTPGSVRVEVLNAETIQLREVGDIVATNDLESQARADRTQRVAVDVVQFDSGGPRPTLVAVDWGRVEARRRGRIARNSVLVTLAGRPVPQQFLGDLLLLRARLEPRTSASSCTSRTNRSITRSTSTRRCRPCAT